MLVTKGLVEVGNKLLFVLEQLLLMLEKRLKNSEDLQNKGGGRCITYPQRSLQIGI